MSAKFDLNPCPFCGGTDVVIAEGSTYRWQVARCGNCDAQTGDVRVPLIGTSSEQRERVISVAVMAKWNTRTSPEQEIK